MGDKTPEKDLENTKRLNWVSQWHSLFAALLVSFRSKLIKTFCVSSYIAFLHTHNVSAFFTLEMHWGQIEESKSESKQRSKQVFNKVEKRLNRLILRKLKLNGHIICVLSVYERLLTLHLGQSTQFFILQKTKNLDYLLEKNFLLIVVTYCHFWDRSNFLRSFKRILNMSQNSSRNSCPWLKT